tara:strand:- start:614 stop:898 length:285 start_codon:yes stop_codon:yes gene_type:complete
MKAIKITKEQTNFVEVEIDLSLWSANFDLEEMYKNSDMYSDDFYTIECYIKSLINGETETEEEERFFEYYEEMERIEYRGMPNQSLKITAEIIN